MKKIYFAVLGILSLIFINSNAEAFSRPDSSRIFKAQQDIRAIETAIELFKMDVGRYPANSEGLTVLLSASEEFEQSENYKQEGYLLRLPKDPWGSEYQYKYPGIHNVEKFDLWTLGADGKQGGEGINGDFGNWPGSFDDIHKQLRRENAFIGILTVVASGSLVGFCVGLPVYLFGLFLRLRAGDTVTAAVKGFHLGVLLYLVLLIPVVGTILNLIIFL